MATGLALVVLFLIAVILLLLIDRGGLKGLLDAKDLRIASLDNLVATQDRLIAAFRASHDDLQEIALKALRGDFERRTDR